jgi:hypothetical protein
MAKEKIKKQFAVQAVCEIGASWRVSAYSEEEAVELAGKTLPDSVNHANSRIIKFKRVARIKGNT